MESRNPRFKSAHPDSGPVAIRTQMSKRDASLRLLLLLILLGPPPPGHRLRATVSPPTSRSVAFGRRLSQVQRLGFRCVLSRLTLAVVCVGAPLVREGICNQAVGGGIDLSGAGLTSFPSGAFDNVGSPRSVFSAR